VRTLAPACEVVVLNAAELAFLGSHLGLASAADLCRLGVRVVVLTRGGDGCDVWSANEHLHQPALPAARIVDTTGAGDALMSGFLAAYWRSGDVALAARWGVANAAAVIARRGSQVGLFTVDEIEAMLAGPGMTVHTRKRVPGETGTDVPASMGTSAEARPALAPGALRDVARLSEKGASCGRGE
jgi:sugar/nucleoside kinase (ribokinase family)